MSFQWWLCAAATVAASTWRCTAALNDTAATPTPTAAALAAALQPVVDAVSLQHNVSFTVGVRTAGTNGSVTVQAGDNDRAAGTPMAPQNRFPVGSVTKSWTATAVMQLWEAGRIDIDAPIAQYVDPILLRQNGTTMLELWNNDTTVHNVTARLLMGMRAGLHDYDDQFFRNFTFTHLDQYWTPFDILHQLNKSWLCAPGTCGAYASPGYVILGLALAELHNCSTWQEFDPRSVIPPDVLDQYTDVVFPNEVPCSADPDIVHQYTYEVHASPDPNATGDAAVIVSFPDIVKYSCLNGWTCGNIAASIGDIAAWFYDLFHGVQVRPATLVQMMNGIPLSQGWSPGLSYGLGTMQVNLGAAVDKANLTWTIGHGGCDYGSIALLSGYNARFNFSLSVGANAVSPMNCSAAYRAHCPATVGSMYSQEFYWQAVCWIYDAVLQTLTNATVPRLLCAAIDPTNPFTAPALPSASASSGVAAAAVAVPATAGAGPPRPADAQFFAAADAMCPRDKAGRVCRGALRPRGARAAAALLGSAPAGGVLTATPNYTCSWEFE